MKSLALRVLSDFGVDGVEPGALGSKKGRLTLCVLALAGGQVVPTDVLVDTLWGDAPPARPEDQLAVLISRLRSVLGRERIQHRDRGYLLVCDWLDASELAALTEEMDRRRGAGNVLGAAAAARVALSLLRGYGLPSVPGEWAQLRLAELDRLAVRARRAAATALLEAGDWMAAADAATAAVAVDGYDEASLRVLLRAYVAGGRVAAALAAYARAREHLATELGTDPSPETVALYTAILRGELPTPSPAPARGPIGLVGRDAELAYLDTTAGRARDGSTEVVVVDGEAGIGKTALLRAWAAQRAAAGDTVLLASCGQLDQAMPLDALLSALSALLRRLGPDAAADLLGRDALTLTSLLGMALDPPASPGLRGPGEPRPSEPILADSMLGPAVLYAALVRVLVRLARRGSLVVVVIDDAHLAGRALANWLSFAQRAGMPAVVVAAIRSGEGPALPGTASVHLGLLDRAAAAELVGPSRVDELYERSKGHPLFLTELAQQAARAELPMSLVESVSARCDELGPAGAMLRAAAVIGPELDIELLAALLGRPAVDLLDDAEHAAAQQLLATDGGTFRFRHEMVREALAASATVGRAALLHRQAGRVLARQPYADPAIVAYHARLGGDLELAARSLRTAAERAAERFDHAAAEALLDDALRLHPDPEGWLERARVRTRRRRYPEALADVELAAAAGAAALEVGAWACYFDRRFAQDPSPSRPGGGRARSPPTSRFRPGWTWRPSGPSGWPARPATTRTRCGGRRAVGWTAGGSSAGGEHQHVHHERAGPGHGGLRGRPELGLASSGQRADERGHVGHAQPPRCELGRAGQAGVHRDRPQPDVGVARRGRVPAQRRRVAGPRLGVPLERDVPRWRLVTERPQDLVHRRLGRVVPAGRERAGGQRPGHAARLPQARHGTVQVAQAERGQGQVEAVVTERQRGHVGRHRMQPGLAPAQHAWGRVGADHRPRPGGQRGPAGHPGPGTQVQHPAARQPGVFRDQ